MSLVELAIPSGSVYVGVARLAVASLAREAGLGEEAVDDLKIAVSEACANAVLSNQKVGASSPVDIGFERSQSAVIVSVADRGPVYEPTPADDFDTGSTEQRFAMSLELLSSLVDDCLIVPRDDGGMRVSLTVELP